MISTKFWNRQTTHIIRTSVGNKIVDHSDVVGTSPHAAPYSCGMLYLTPYIQDHFYFFLNEQIIMKFPTFNPLDAGFLFYFS